MARVGPASSNPGQVAQTILRRSGIEIELYSNPVPQPSQGKSALSLAARGGAASQLALAQNPEIIERFFDRDSSCFFLDLAAPRDLMEP
jgi:hypothetical protein